MTSQGKQITLLALRGVSLGLILWLVLGTMMNSRAMANEFSTTSIGYNKPVFMNAPLASVIAKLPSNSGVAAFNAQGLYWPSKHVPIVLLPVENYYCPAQCVADANSAFLKDVKDGSVTYFAYQELGMTPQQVISLGVTLRVEMIVADGTLYKVSPLRS